MVLPNINTLSDIFLSDSKIQDICQYGIILEMVANVTVEEETHIVYVFRYIHNGQENRTILPKCLVDKFFKETEF